ncbi:hypothetical protein PI124_g4198 [Phytophthora idaei]|nr:hypothetical protein PI124_g4198 [Phytophthora idaei]
MTPPVLYERIVPHLRKKWWQIARGRGLEEGDRIYRPGFKNKGKLAKRDDDFFLFVNDILTPEQVWMPHELSSEDEPNERKRNVAKTIKSGGKNKAAHNGDTTPVKRQRRSQPSISSLLRSRQVSRWTER